MKMILLFGFMTRNIDTTLFVWILSQWIDSQVTEVRLARAIIVSAVLSEAFERGALTPLIVTLNTLVDSEIFVRETINLGVALLGIQEGESLGILSDLREEFLNNSTSSSQEE